MAPSTPEEVATWIDLEDGAAVRQLLDDYVANGAPAGAGGGRKKAVEGQDRAARRATFDAWYDESFRPAIRALVSDGRVFTASEARLLLTQPAPSTGSSGAAFRRAKASGLVRVVDPERGMARSTTASAHRRHLRTWIGAGAPLPDGHVEADS